MLNAENYKETLLAVIKQLIEAVPKLEKDWGMLPDNTPHLTLPTINDVYTQIVKSSRTTWHVLFNNASVPFLSGDLGGRIKLTISQDMLTFFDLYLSRNKYGHSGVIINKYIDPHELGWKKDLFDHVSKQLRD